MSKLPKLRNEIDRIDTELVRLLCERAHTVLQVKKEKENHGLEVYSPEREREILQKVSSLVANEPISEQAAVSVFREIISATRALIGELVISYLGPQLSRAQDAARAQFGAGVTYLPASSIAEVLSHVESGKANYGVLPIERADAGVLFETLKELIHGSLLVVAEVYSEYRSHSASDEGLIRERYFTIGKSAPKATGRDRTVMIGAVEDRSGALHQMLQPFANLGITLTKIESKPMPGRSFETLFYIETVGHQNDPKLADCVEQLRTYCQYFRVLGSFPESSMLL